MAIPQGPNERWSLDFLSDAFADGRFRVLAIVDDFSRECLALVADTSLPGLRVVRELEAFIARRGRPAMCVSHTCIAGAFGRARHCGYARAGAKGLRSC
jgi:putative transposase